MSKSSSRPFNSPYTGDHLNQVAFPLGGIGAGMICLEGTGALSNVSLRHKPEVFNEPCVFSALCLKGEKNLARVLEGPVPGHKIFGTPETGRGKPFFTYGLPRFSTASFAARFPFATVTLTDPALPLAVEITGWSPFIPGDSDASSLPCAALEYRIKNTGRKKIQAVYSFHAQNFMSRKTGGDAVLAAPRGFVLWQAGKKKAPHEQGAFCAEVLEGGMRTDCHWFRGGWFDPLTMAWKNIASGRAVARPPVRSGEPAPGGSLYVPLTLGPRGEKTVRLLFSWHVPHSDICSGGFMQDTGCGCGQPRYQPWYAGKFKTIQAVSRYWQSHYGELRRESFRFSECFYDTTLPPEVTEAVAANLAILKSPTVMRQIDGRLWGWEGCNDNSGCCPGSCTHVWNYAQAIPHLFPDLERSFRETEFEVGQDRAGRQNFRSPLPIRPSPLGHYAAADGQLGGIMKAYREWRVSGDQKWLRRIWPKVKASLDYCIKTWDPGHKGVIEEPHHNTYDIEFWGPDGMHATFYLGALQAAIRMGDFLGETVEAYRELFTRGRKFLEARLFNGEYYFQKIQWKGLRAPDPMKIAGQSMDLRYSAEATEIFRKEGPKYQYGKGCLSDGVLGAWMAAVCGVPDLLDQDKIKKHLRSVHRYNFKSDLWEHANPQRPGYALGHEGGLLLCTWPKGGQLSLPFVYSNEVWTGIEYQAASHMMLHGLVKEGLDVVRACRARYDGRVRNPFNEFECGHWYARAMSSYGLLQGMTGIRYDAVEKTLYIRPHIKGDFRSFLSTATGYGTAGIRKGKPFVEVKSGKIGIRKIKYQN